MTASFANFVVTKRPSAERGAFRGRRYDNHLVVLGVLSLETSAARRRLLPRLTLNGLNPSAAATKADADRAIRPRPALASARRLGSSYRSGRVTNWLKVKNSGFQRR